MTYIDSLSEKVNDLKKQGYSEDFGFENGKLVANNKEYKKNDVVKLEEYRFEGKTNPDDMSILYQIEMEDGTKGTITDAFGPQADPELSQFMLAAED